jgi:CHAT domain-containing protein/tetratricopeptide (TPR) repeat protein
LTLKTDRKTTFISQIAALLVLLIVQPCFGVPQARAQSPELARATADYVGHYNAARFAEALPFAERVVELSRTEFGPDSNPLAVAYYTAGNLLFGLERYHDADAALRNAAAIFARLPDSRAQLVQTQVVLAGVLVSLSKLEEGVALMRRSVENLEGLLGIDDPRVRTALNNLGQTLQIAGRAGEAVPIYRRLIAGLDAGNGGNFETLGVLHANLSGALQETGDSGEAMATMRSAVAFLRRLGNPNHPYLGIVVNSLGYLEYLAGRLGEAEKLYREGMAIIERTTGADTPNYAMSLANLAALLKDLGRRDEAEALSRQAFAIFEARLGPGHPKSTNVLDELALFASERGDWTTALELYDRVTLQSQAQLRASPVRDGERTRSSYGLDSGNLPAHIRAIHRAKPDDPVRRAQAFELFQRAQDSRTAMAVTQMAARFASGDSELARLLRAQQDLMPKRDGIDKRLIGVLGAGSAALEQRTQLQNELHAADRELARIGAELQTRFPDYGALVGGEPLPVAAAQRLLGPAEVLIGFLETPPQWHIPGDLHVFALTREEFRWLRLDAQASRHAWWVPGLRCGLDEGAWHTEAGRRHCAEWTGIERSAADVDRRKPLPFRLDYAHQLYLALLAPVADMLRQPDGTWRHLIVVAMQGPLSRLPLHVLVTERPARSLLQDSDPAGASVAWLGARQPITILPSIASLQALRLQAKASRASEPYLGFGNPLLTGRNGTDRRAWDHQHCAAAPRRGVQVAARTALRDAAALVRAGIVDIDGLRRQDPLPETAEELCAVATALGAPPGAVYLAAEATELRIKSLSASGALGRARVLHFATHGLVSGETGWFAANKAEPALILTPPDVPSDNNDGLLTASEVATLRLDADWVVLSACNTAAGDGSGAEALSGLARAFFYAGARALLVSHWLVDSDAAVGLVTQAFATIVSNPAIGRAEAMRRAMKALAVSGGRQAHPSNWAPFSIVGEGGAIQR